MDNKIINKFKEILYSNMSYTNQDFESILKEIVDLVQGGDLPTHWNNLTETDPIMMLLALMAAHKDILNYMIDYRILETYMSTARERASLVRIANSYGYKIPSYNSARILYEIDRKELDPFITHILHPFTELRDSNGVSWTYVGPELELDYSATAPPYRINLYQGSPQIFTFLGTQVDPISKTRVVSGSNVALGNTYDFTDMVSLVYADGTVFKYTPLTQTVEQGDLIFDMDVDTLGLTYIKFINTLNLDNEYSGEFMLRYINTSGEANITPTQNLTILTEKQGTDEIIQLDSEYVSGSYYVGKNPATPNEIKEGFKNFYAGIKSLVTARDYANYIKNIQRVVPQISKVFVLDKQTDSDGGTGSLYYPGGEQIADLTVAIYATTWDGTEHIALTPGEITNLVEDLTRYKITGVQNVINENGVNSSNDLTGVTALVEIDGDIDSDKEELVFEAITELVLGANIGSTLSAKDITNLLMERDLAKYYRYGFTVSFYVDSDYELKHELKYNEYFNDIDFNGEW